MISDLSNGVLGLFLIYVSILRQPVLQSSQGMLVMAALGVAVTTLAFLGLKAHEAWYSRSTIALGVALALFGGVAAFAGPSLTLSSWVVFWIGTFTSVISIWAALYPRNLEPQQ